MAIAFRSSQTATVGSGVSITVNKPSGVASGDLLVAALTYRGDMSVTSAPAGWTSIRSDENGTSSADITTHLYYKIADGSEGASYQWSFNTGNAITGGIAAYTGVASSSPVDDHDGAAGASGSSPQVPSQTSTEAGCLLVGVFAVRPASSTATFTPPAGMTERWDINNGFNDSAEFCDEILGAAGATGTRTATATASGQYAASGAIFKPGAATGDGWGVVPI